MTVKVIALVTINEDEPRALAEYLAATMPLLDAAGGKIVERVRLGETIAGETRAETMIVVHYPDRDAVSQVFDSPVYRAITKTRDRAFSYYSVSIVSG